MPAGIKFFGEDFNSSSYFNNVITVSSNDSNKGFALDNLNYTKWVSSGENTDGNQVTFEVDYSSYTERGIDSFYLENTNISNAEFEYWNGSAWVLVEDGVNATVIKGVSDTYVYAKLNSPVTVTKVRVKGDSTFTADQEKEFYEFRTFLEIGEFETRPDIFPKFTAEEEIHTLSDARKFIFRIGKSFGARLDVKSLVRQNDIDLIEDLLLREVPMFIWICGGDVEQFSYSFKPYRFQDLYKVEIVGDEAPKVTRNYYKAGYNNVIYFVEVP